MAVPLSEVQRFLQEAAQFPNSVQNYFQRYPLIRVGRWGVFAPLPDLLLQSWDLRNLFDNLELTLANVGERGGAEFYRALGVVFEVYVHDLLKELANLSNGSFVAPFKCDNGNDSADGFVLTPNLPPVCFEVKCYRIPQAAYVSADLSSFTSWFASLLGTNEKGRAPLVQGANFFQTWRAADKAILSNLGPDSENAIYLIVSYEDIPMFCVWHRFRDWYARMHLDPSTKALWSRTAVMSVRELETLVAAAKARSASGGSFPLVQMLRDYLAYRDNAPDAVADPPCFKDGLGDWLARADESVRAQEPTIIADARNRLFEHAQECGFGAVTQ